MKRKTYKLRKQVLTYHMMGILQILSDSPLRPIGFIPTALMCLAAHGYVRVGKKASLTRKARDLMQAGNLVEGAYL
jgi:hypothetical protein